MKNIYKLFSVLSLLLITALSYAQSVSAPVSVWKQDQDQWCWAADSKCILAYYGFPMSQCTIVEYARTLQPNTFGSQNCCPMATSCNKPNEIDYNYGIKGMIDHFGQIKSVATKNALAVTKIVSELTAQRPFVIGVYWSGGGGHVVVGCGYNSTTQAITFMDSWQNNGMTTKKYTGGTAFSTNSGSGTWAEYLVLLSDPTSVSNMVASNDQVNVFPSPSSVNSEIIINSDLTLKSINVFNNMVQLISKLEDLSSKSYSVKIPAAGFYTLQVITEKGTANKKIVVQ